MKALKASTSRMILMGQLSRIRQRLKLAAAACGCMRALRHGPVGGWRDQSIQRTRSIILLHFSDPNLRFVTGKSAGHEDHHSVDPADALAFCPDVLDLNPYLIPSIHRITFLSVFAPALSVLFF